MASTHSSKHQLLKSLLNDARAVVLKRFETGKGFAQCSIMVRCFVPLTHDSADESHTNLYKWLDASCSAEEQPVGEATASDTLPNFKPCTIHAFDLIAGTFKPIPIASMQVKRVPQQSDRNVAEMDVTHPDAAPSNSADDVRDATKEALTGGYTLQVATEAFEACVDLHAIMIMESSLAKLYQRDARMTVQTHAIRMLNLQDGAFPAHLEFALRAQAARMKRSFGGEINYERYVKMRDVYIKQLSS